MMRLWVTYWNGSRLLEQLALRQRYHMSYKRHRDMQLLRAHFSIPFHMLLRVVDVANRLVEKTEAHVLVRLLFLCSKTSLAQTKHHNRHPCICTYPLLSPPP